MKPMKPMRKTMKPMQQTMQPMQKPMPGGRTGNKTMHPVQEPMPGGRAETQIMQPNQKPMQGERAEPPKPMKPIVHCTLYIVHCALYIVHCTLYIVQCALYIVHCRMHIVHCTLYIVPTPLDRECAYQEVWTQSKSNRNQNPPRANRIEMANRNRKSMEIEIRIEPNRYFEEDNPIESIESKPALGSGISQTNREPPS